MKKKLVITFYAYTKLSKINNFKIPETRKINHSFRIDYDLNVNIRKHAIKKRPTSIFYVCTKLFKINN